MRPDFSRFSIRTLMLVLVLATVAPLAAMFAWFRFDDARLARERAQDEVAILAANATKNLEQFLGRTEAVLERLAARPLVRALDPRRCDPIVAEYVHLNPQFTTLGIRDVEGNIVCSYLPNPIARLNPRDFPWFEEGLRSGKFTAGNAFLGRQVGRWVSVLTHPIRDDGGRVIGLLALPVDLLKLGGELLGSVPGGALVTVTDRNAVLLMRSVAPEKYLGMPAPPRAEEAARGLREGFLTTSGSDGVSRLYKFQTLPGVEWRVVAGIPEAEVLADYHSRLKRNLAIGGVALLFALTLGLLVARNLVKPIAALAGAVEKVAAGDSALRVTVAGPAEVNLVARQLNRMLDARDRSEAILRDSEENLAITLQSIGDAVIATDAQGGVTRMNPTAERLTGWTLAEATGRPLGEVFRIVNARTGAPAADPVAQVLESGRVVGLANHTALRARDGREYQISDSAAPIRDRSGAIAGVVLVFIDVTEQYRTRQALEDSELRLKSLIANLPGYVYRVANDADHTPQFISEGVRKITGYAQREYLVDRTIGCGEERHPEDREAVSRAIRAAVFAGEAYECEYRIVAKSGELKWASERGHGVYSTSGELVAIEGFVTEVTDRKRAEELRASLETQLRESQKMEAIGTLAGGIAHDFNNIIGAVLGNAELARHDAGDNPALLESLEEIRKASHRAHDLVQQILSFSRRQPTQRRPVALDVVVGESVRLLRATLPARVRIESHVAPGLGLVSADPTQIEQVLLNLGVNASQAMAGRPGRIDIRVEAVTLDAREASRLSRDLAPGNYIRLSVIDDGDGMDEATMARIFEPFFTTKPLGEGTGLGLAVVHGIVRVHEGALAVRSSPGKGSRFDVYLPVVAGDVAVAVPAPATPSAPQGQGQQVLYIDDDQAQVFLVGRLLGKRGYRVSGHQDQVEALSLLRADPSRFQLVVTDYNMPGMSGLDVARAVHDIRPDLPVVLASGFVTDELRTMALKAGVAQVIFKGNAVEEFCDAVQRLVGSRPAGA